MEESVPGTVLLDLKKELSVGNGSYNILRKNETTLNLIQFDEKTGIMRLANRLDREQWCPRARECILKYELGQKVPFKMLNIFFEIEDINDNNPTFDKSFMNANISENSPPSKFFLLHSADDLDSPQYGIAEYYLDPQQNSYNLKNFNLKIEKNPSGSISDVWLLTNKALDREERSSYTLNVVAKDHGSKTGTTTIEVNVLDINDNSPKFQSHFYYLNLTENSPPQKNFIVVKAVDQDDGSNANIKYSFTKKTRKLFGHLFKINNSSGSVSQTKSLDYEKFNFISLEIIAQDEGIPSLSSLATININVINMNDNPPKIKLEGKIMKKGEIWLSEDTPTKTHVGSFSVWDEDGDEDIYCHLPDNQFKEYPFKLKKKSSNDFSIETQKKLDREKVKRYTVTIQCMDGEEGDQTSEASFSVFILDVNDNDPQFTSDVYKISIEENNQPYKKLNFSIQAIDRDEGTNGSVTYQIQSYDEKYFQIDPKSAEIWTVESLDREKNSFLKFEVVALDGSENLHKDLRKSSTALVTVSVIDVNDEPPLFSQPTYNFSIMENAATKVQIGKLDALDLDLKSKKSFSLVSKEDLGLLYFRIDQKSGNIFATRKLDREDKSFYKLKAIVKDDHKPGLRDTSDVNIEVLDANDNIPIIYFPSEGNNTIYISRETQVGELVTTVEARDYDAGNNSKLTYEISENYAELFRIDTNSGNLYLNRGIPEEINSMSLKFLVKDQGDEPNIILSSSLNVLVDNMPITRQVSRPITMQRILTEAHLAVVVGVAAGCLLIILILICIVCSVGQKEAKKRKDRNLAPKVETNYEIFGADVKFNPCALDNKNDEANNFTDDRNQIRESLILNDIPENSESIVLSNLNRDLPQSEAEKKNSRLYSASCEPEENFNSEKNFSYNLNEMFGHNSLSMKDTNSLTKFRHLNGCRDTMFAQNDYGNGQAISSPDWLIKAVQQRKSFSRWLNSDNVNGLPPNIHEYSTIPSSNRLNAKLNDESLLMTRTIVDSHKKKPIELLNEQTPLVFENNLPVKSSPTYVGLYSRPYSNRSPPIESERMDPMQNYSIFKQNFNQQNQIL